MNTGFRRPVLAFRIQNTNLFTFPVLLNQLERNNLDSNFEIMLLKSSNQIREFTQSGRHGMVLYSFMTPHLPDVMREINWILNNRQTGLYLLAGGPHTSGDPESSLKAGFDYAFVGPAETGFVWLMKQYLQQNLPLEKSVFMAPPLLNLDNSSPVNKFISTMPPLEITRGCYWNCQFCQTACSKAQHRSLESYKEYYAQLKKRGFHRRVNFICPSAFEYGSRDARHLNYEAVGELLEFARKEGTTFLEYGIFPSESRPNTFTAPFVQLVARMCSNKKLTIGAQSGSNRQLKLIRRGHSVEDVRNACELTISAGLQPLVDMIMGFPGENRDDRQQTLQLIKELSQKYHARIQVHYFLPLSGTNLADTTPTPLDYRTTDTLEAYQEAGVCTGWWKDGQIIAGELTRVLKHLSETETEYPVIRLAE